MGVAFLAARMLTCQFSNLKYPFLPEQKQKEKQSRGIEVEHAVTEPDVIICHV